MFATFWAYKDYSDFYLLYVYGMVIYYFSETKFSSCKNWYFICDFSTIEAQFLSLNFYICIKKEETKKIKRDEEENYIKGNFDFSLHNIVSIFCSAVIT